TATHTPHRRAAGAGAIGTASVSTLAPLLLFRVGTQGWFDGAAIDQYGVSKNGRAQDPYPAYVYTDDLTLHEEWRAGYFDPVWLPHPPAGQFAIGAQQRGAPAHTAIFGDAKR